MSTQASRRITTIRWIETQC